MKGLRVDLSRSDVKVALDLCYYDFETILQALILWALYCEEEGKPLQFPNKTLTQAIAQQWKPREYSPWSDKILSNPRFQSPGTKWWIAAAEGLGRDVRNQLIADVDEKGSQQYVLFRNGLTLRLNTALNWDWEKIRAYGERQTR
ncbi:hypothetical protein M595_3439 [Lyngbya aestuarii BL J]|mgnify:CR=1 FL=1|uniref:Uncharacterized protein n=1 Tax=Lyngbya aestuarii BL J TaxID=1348334 RepID=U7QFB2_9CYAN|nr:hypothetical protein [Lyngbya aestuarii]ERT06593.1 hypothetical protein M595_3439 [Lyngbya aestuarii BL J]